MIINDQNSKIKVEKIINDETKNKDESIENKTISKVCDFSILEANRSSS